MSTDDCHAAPDPAALLGAARARTLSLVGGLTPQQWLGPRLHTVNPALWELGHLGWFEEYWCLRRNRAVPGLLSGADALYDSARVPHAARWDLPLPSPADTLHYLASVREAAVERLRGDPGNGYFGSLCAFHEEMHCEAFTYTRQTLGHAAPGGTAPAADGGPWTGDAEIAGGRFLLGAEPDSGFVFDNEKSAHAVEVRPFRMARAPVTNGQYAEFVESGGYRRSEWWSREGWHWLRRTRSNQPLYWENGGSGWRRRLFDRMEALPEHEPVVHVSWHEADAWCRWAGRRLPTEAEWEFAASTLPGEHGAKRRHPWGESLPDGSFANLYGSAGRCLPVNACPAGDSAWGLRQMTGNVWEWTADWFQPYPGYIRDPYAEYSEPWFGSHKVLRGGCHATRNTLIRNSWRNFYTPDRNDVYAGFRTCAL